MLALVRDDAEMNNLVMVASLRPLAGCTPQAFTVPAEALAFAEARASEIGVVITDYEMPGMNGVAFIRAVRRIPGLTNVPTVMVTSHDQRSLRREGGCSFRSAKPSVNDSSGWGRSRAHVSPRLRCAESKLCTE